MSKKTEEKYLADMLQYAREAVALTTGTAHDSYQRDRVLQLALTYLLQIIGEAASHLTEATRSKMPQIPWGRITGMRHRLVHDYATVSHEIVWDAVHNDLPELIAALEKVTPPEPPSSC